MREISLTKGKIAIIDDEDYQLVSQYSWSATTNGSTWYAKATVKKGDKQTTIRMHRLIMGATSSKQLVDHINGNGLLNIRSNLRFCNHLGNSRNSAKKENKQCEYKGVTLRQGDRPFVARITVNKKTKTLGYFNTDKEAALCYNEAAKEYFGDFAQLNIV